MFDGILIINKDEGMTSFDVIRRLRRILKTKRLGHTGTLDPMARGVLCIFAGKATRFCSYAFSDDKEYVATFRFGIKTDTLDITGAVLQKSEVTAEFDEISKAVLSFWGESFQIPPMYSAVKIDGRKLYESARAGETVARVPRRILIKEMEILSYNEALFELTVRIVCSKGTYIRSLAEDIGDKLGCGAVLSALLRTRSGRFRICDAVSLHDLESMTEDEIARRMMPADSLLSSLPDLVLTCENERRAKNGALVYCDDMPDCTKCGGARFRVYDSLGEFFMIMKTLDMGEGRFALTCERYYC